MIQFKKFSIILVSYLLIISILGTIFIYSDEVEAQSSYSLYDAAITYEHISVTIQGAYGGTGYFSLDNGNGVFFGKCIEMEVENKISSTLYLTVNLGRQLICRESSIQNMGVTENYYFTLYSYEKKTITVNAMCMNMYEDAPVEGAYYDLGPICSGDAYDVISEIGSINSQDASGQCALWAVTDNADGDYLRNYGADDDDVNKAQGILDAAGVNYNIESGGGGFTLSLIFILFMIIIIVVSIAIVIVVVLKLKKRTSHPPPAPIVQPNQTVQPTPSVQPSQPVQQKPLEPSDQTTTKFCTYCGSPVPPGSKFCEKCGQKL